MVVSAFLSSSLIIRRKKNLPPTSLPRVTGRKPSHRPLPYFSLATARKHDRAKLGWRQRRHGYLTPCAIGVGVGWHRQAGAWEAAVHHRSFMAVAWGPDRDVVGCVAVGRARPGDGGAWSMASRSGGPPWQATEAKSAL